MWASVVVARRLSCPKVYGTFVPKPGIEPTPPTVQGRFLTTRPPGKSHGGILNELPVVFVMLSRRRFSQFIRSIFVRASQVAQWERTHLPVQETQETWVWSLGREDTLEREIAPYSSILAWKIPWTEAEPGGL